MLLLSLNFLYFLFLISPIQNLFVHGCCGTINTVMYSLGHINGWWGMFEGVQTKKGLEMYMSHIKVHVTGYLEMQYQVNWMHGWFKHMSGLMQATILRGISNRGGMGQRHLKSQSWNQIGFAVWVWVGVHMLIVIAVLPRLGLLVPNPNKNYWYHNRWIRVWVGLGLLIPNQNKNRWCHTYKKRIGVPSKDIL